MLKSLENHEHAEHMAHASHPHTEHADNNSGSQHAALLVAVLAACLAITEQGAKHAEIRVAENSIFAIDAWSQYQAKSTRGSFSKDFSDMLGVLGVADPEVAALRTKLAERLKQDQDRFESDPKDGKKAIAQRAEAFEEVRDHSLEQTHAYHNAAAAMELAIVLSTASAITKSRLLIIMALCLGIAGGVIAVLGYVAPQLGAF
jgi:hypothetical protein